MNVVDSSGWLEYFGKGTNGEFFAPVIEDSSHLVVPTISIYEVFKRIVLQRDEEEALRAIGWMAVGQLANLTQEIALSAAILSVEHRLPMADSIILATAQIYQATLWTQDDHFKDLPGVMYVEKQ
jgi:toxin FitB